MPTKLQDLPTEVLQLIFVYLWSSEIFHAFWNLHRYLDGVIDSHVYHYVDFRDLHKKSYKYLMKNLKHRIKCLVISNEGSVPEFAKVQNFLARNNLSEFTILDKLSLVDIDDSYYIEVLANISNFSKLACLKVDRLPSYEGSRIMGIVPKLKRLDLPDASFFDRQPEKLFKNLRCVSVNRCTLEQFQNIFNILPETLHSFALKEGIFSTISNNAWPQFPRVPRGLQRINLQIDIVPLTIDELQSLLSRMRSLTYIDIKAEGEMDLVDGERWKRFLLNTYGNQLMKFNFCFTISSNVDMHIDDVLISFSSSFWLNRSEPWYVAHRDGGLFCTIPHYALTVTEGEKDLTCATTANNEKVFYNCIRQLIISEQTIVPKYLFEKVTFLRFEFQPEQYIPHKSHFRQMTESLTRKVHEYVDESRKKIHLRRRLPSPLRLGEDVQHENRSSASNCVTFKPLTSIVDIASIQHMEISNTIPSGLLDFMRSLYRLSLVNIKLIFVSLQKVGWERHWKQIIILDIVFDSEDECYFDVRPEFLCPLFPNITRLTVVGVITPRAYIYELIDRFSQLIYGKFEIDWSKEEKQNAIEDFAKNTNRLIFNGNKTNFSLYFEVIFVHVSIWDTPQ